VSVAACSHLWWPRASLWEQSKDCAYYMRCLREAVGQTITRDDHDTRMHECVCVLTVWPIQNDVRVNAGFFESINSCMKSTNLDEHPTNTINARAAGVCGGAITHCAFLTSPAMMPGNNHPGHSHPHTGARRSRLA
jgi:hypothetical protein